jgi:hypothetical protein
MKKFMLLMLAGLALLAAPAEAKKAAARARAESSETQNLLTLSPMILISSASSYGALLGYEHAVGDANSFLVNGLVQTSGPAGYNLTVLGVGGGFRWYLLGGNLSGLYVGPKLMVESATYSYTYTYSARAYTASASTSLFKAGADLGYQTKVWKELFVGANFELAYTSGTLAATGLAGPGLALDGTTLGSNAMVGWGF